MRKTFGEPGVVVEPTLYFAGTDATDGTELWSGSVTATSIAAAGPGPTAAR